MEEIKVWENSFNNNFTYFKSEKELIDYIKYGNVNYFCIDDKDSTEPISNFAYIDISKTLYINEEFYKKNKQILDGYFIQNMIFASDIMISKHLYSEDLIKKLICAKTIILDEEIDISSEIKEVLSNKGVELFIKDGDNIEKLLPVKIFKN